MRTVDVYSNVLWRFGRRWNFNNWYRDLAPTFHRGEGQKSEIWRRFQHHSSLSRPRLKMQQDILTLKQTSCVAMIALCPLQVWCSWVHALLRTVGQKCPTPKIARRKRAKSSITQPWIIWFHSNFVQSLNTWQSKCYKSSKSRGQRSRSQRDITCAKNRELSITVNEVVYTIII